MGVIKREVNQLNGAVGTVERLGIIRKRVRKMQLSLLNQKLARSIYFQIVLRVIMMIRYNGWVVPRDFNGSSSLTGLVVLYVIYIVY